MCLPVSTWAGELDDMDVASHACRCLAGSDVMCLFGRTCPPHSKSPLDMIV